MVYGEGKKPPSPQRQINTLSGMSPRKSAIAKCGSIDLYEEKHHILCIINVMRFGYKQIGYLWNI
jgi:hypothetical protein